ncbi:hypothetical protein ACFPQ1_27195 [Rhodocytophaga aerolata]|uniref:hypothetical protein n=1 Tax=Rhodocytophaga aerolata TaxID=455078 RepID=UPI003621A7F9
MPSKQGGKGTSLFQGYQKRVYILTTYADCKLASPAESTDLDLMLRHLCCSILHLRFAYRKLALSTILCYLQYQMPMQGTHICFRRPAARL